METVPVSTLEGSASFTESLHHLSGRMILHRGFALEPLLLAALKRAGVEDLILCNESEADELHSRLRRIETQVKDLREGRPLESSLYDADGQMLLASGQILLRHHLRLFEKRGISAVYRLPEAQLEEIARVSRELSALSERALSEGASGDGILGLAAAGFPAAPARPGAPRGPRGRPDGAADLLLIERMSALTEAAGTIRGVLSAGRPGDFALSAARVLSAVEGVLEAVESDEPLAVASAHLQSDLRIKDAPGGSYLADHMLNVCLLSTAVGMRLGLDRTALRELGAAAFLHDVGMLFLPEWLVNKPGELAPEERLELGRHPGYGFSALAGPWGLPLSVALSARMHHERADGSGYPDGRKLARIHPYARIIAVADVYDAVGHERPHRKGALPPEPAEAVARAARAGTLDRDAARALLEATSGYPPGAVVELSSGELARVVEPGGAASDRPVVVVLRTAGGGAPPERKAIRLADERELRITRAVGAEEFPVELGEGF